MSWTIAPSMPAWFASMDDAAVAGVCGPFNVPGISEVHIAAWPKDDTAFASVAVSAERTNVRRATIGLSANVANLPVVFGWLNRVLREQPCNERRIKVGADFHDLRVSESAQPAVPVVKLETVFCGRCGM